MKRYKVVFGFIKSEGKGVRIRDAFRCYEDVEVADLARRCKIAMKRMEIIDRKDKRWIRNLMAELEQIAGK